MLGTAGAVGWRLALGGLGTRGALLLLGRSHEGELIRRCPQVLQVDGTFAALAAESLAALGQRSLVAFPRGKRTDDQSIGAGALYLAADMAAVIALHITDDFHLAPPLLAFPLAEGVPSDIRQAGENLEPFRTIWKERFG